MKRKRKKDRGRMYNTLNSKSCHNNDMDGFAFILQPNIDPVAWKALQHYASITPNVAQRQALLVWLREHENPAGPEAVQMEMEMEL